MPPSDLPQAGLAAFRSLLNDFEALLQQQDDVRLRVRQFVPLSHQLRRVGTSLLPESEGLAARDRILDYFRRYQGQVIDGDELAVVAGISEWARRVRELRVEMGWEITSGVTLQQMADTESNDAEELRRYLAVSPQKKLRPDQYVLTSPDQDRDAAHRWNMLNQIRKEKISVKQKLLKFFLKNVGRSITGEELRYLAGNATEWARRTRELRTEEGWAVVTRNTGRPSLPIGSYMLEHDRQAEPHDRRIPDDVRFKVLVRDSYSCQECGWNRQQNNPDDPRNFIELHHKIEHAAGGENTLENLVTLCNICHDKEHRKTKGA